MRRSRQGCSGRRNGEVWPGVVHRVGAPLAVSRPSDADLNGVCGTLQDPGNGAFVRNSAGDANQQIGVGSAAADVAMDVIVPGELILVIAGRVGGGRILIVV